MSIEEELLKQFLEPLVVYDIKKNIIYSNELFDKLDQTYDEPNGPKGEFVQFVEKDILEGLDYLISQKEKYYIRNSRFNEIHFELKFRVLEFSNGEVGIAVIVRDVTKVRKAHVSLKKSESLFRMTFEKSPIGIVYAKKPNLPIVNCNQRFCEMVSMTKDEVLQKTMIDITHPDDLEEDNRVFGSALSKRQDYLFRPNKRYVCKKGFTAITETHATLIYNKKGEFQYMFALVNDVTEQRVNQKKLLEAQAKLIHSEKLASLGQITAGVAHEINNPVNFIYNGVNNLKRLVEELQDQKVTDKEIIYQDIQQMIDAIDDGAKRTTEIVKSLRMFTKEDVTSKTSFNVIDGIESTLLLLSHRTMDKIGVEKYFSTDKLMVSCYPSQLNQVFMNILTNAIESIDSIGSISIFAEQIKNEAIFEIKDTGIGISPDLYSKVFEPFYSTKGASGTGLGLSISYSIIEKHNGSISIKANQPVGTIVRMIIPII